MLKSQSACQPLHSGLIKDLRKSKSGNHLVALAETPGEESDSQQVQLGASPAPGAAAPRASSPSSEARAPEISHRARVSSSRAASPLANPAGGHVASASVNNLQSLRASAASGFGGGSSGSSSSNLFVSNMQGSASTSLLSKRGSLLAGTTTGNINGPPGHNIAPGGGAFARPNFSQCSPNMTGGAVLVPKVDEVDENDLEPEEVEDLLSKSWLCSTPMLLFVLWASSMGEVYFPDLMNESQMNYWNFKYNADLSEGVKRVFPLNIQLPADVADACGSSASSAASSGRTAAGSLFASSPALLEGAAAAAKSSSSAGSSPTPAEQAAQNACSVYLKNTLMLAWLNTCQDEADCKISVEADQPYQTSPTDSGAPTTEICKQIRPAKGERLDLQVMSYYTGGENGELGLGFVPAEQTSQIIEASPTSSSSSEVVAGEESAKLAASAPGGLLSARSSAEGKKMKAASGDAAAHSGSSNPISHFQNVGRLMEQTVGAKSDLEKCVAKIEYIIREHPSSTPSSWVNTKMIARPMHLLSFLIHRMGNVMVLFFKPQEAKVLHKQNWFLATGPAVCEAMAQICLFTGIVLSCAQLKTIIYCSGSVWSAIGAWLFLQKKLNKWQILGMALVIAGLMSKSKSSFDVVTGSGGGDVFAIFLMLAGTILHSGTNVFNQKILTACASDDIRPIPPASLAVMIGIISCFLYAFYFFGWVWPDFSDIVYHPVKPGKWHLMWIGSAGLLISSWLHAASFFFLLGNIGVVSCGMVKGAQTGAYVLLSHFLWCDYETNAKQCIDTFTGIATFLSIVGVLVYSWGSVYCVAAPPTPETEIEKAAADNFEDSLNNLKVPMSVIQREDGRSVTVYSKTDRCRTSSVYSISMNHVVDEQDLGNLRERGKRSRLGSVEMVEGLEEGMEGTEEGVAKGGA